MFRRFQFLTTCRLTVRPALPSPKPSCRVSYAGRELGYRWRPRVIGSPKAAPHSRFLSARPALVRSCSIASAPPFSIRARMLDGDSDLPVTGLGALDAAGSGRDLLRG